MYLKRYGMAKNPSYFLQIKKPLTSFENSYFVHTTQMNSLSGCVSLETFVGENQQQ